jgi:hypothetical protein
MKIAGRHFLKNILYPSPEPTSSIKLQAKDFLRFRKNFSGSETMIGQLRNELKAPG